MDKQTLFYSLGDGSGLDPLSCLATTHRCYHAAQAYTAKPVALYGKFFSSNIIIKIFLIMKNFSHRNLSLFNSST